MEKRLVTFEQVSKWCSFKTLDGSCRYQNMPYIDCLEGRCPGPWREAEVVGKP